MDQSNISDMAAGVVNAPAARRETLFSKLGDFFVRNQNFSPTVRQAFLVTAASILIFGLIALCAMPFMFELSYKLYIAVFLAFITGLVFGMFFAMVFVTGIIIEQFETIKGKMGIYIMPVTTHNVNNSEYDFDMKVDKSKLN